jgi:hypothetical protein
MTRLQRFFMAILPARWAENLKRESQQWLICCKACGASHSYWDAGGIRWLAASAVKHKYHYCQTCGRIRWMAVCRSEANVPGRAGSPGQ